MLMRPLLRCIAFRAELVSLEAFLKLNGRHVTGLDFSNSSLNNRHLLTSKMKPGLQPNRSWDTVFINEQLFMLVVYTLFHIAKMIYGEKG